MLDRLIDDLNRRLPAAPYEMRVSFRDTAFWLAVLTVGLDLVLGGRVTMLIGVFGGLAAGRLPSPVLLLLVTPMLLALASIPGLRKLRLEGWWLFFLSTFLDLLLALVAVNPLSIVMSALFGYLMLQVHDYFWHRPRLYF